MYSNITLVTKGLYTVLEDTKLRKWLLKLSYPHGHMQELIQAVAKGFEYAKKRYTKDKGILAYDGDKLVGWAYLHGPEEYYGEDTYRFGLFVVPNERKKHIGTALVNQAKELVKGAKIRVNVDDDLSYDFFSKHKNLVMQDYRRRLLKDGSKVTMSSKRKEVATTLMRLAKRLVIANFSADFDTVFDEVARVPSFNDPGVRQLRKVISNSIPDSAGFEKFCNALDTVRAPWKGALSKFIDGMKKKKYQKEFRYFANPKSSKQHVSQVSELFSLLGQAFNQWAEYENAPVK